MAVGLAAPPLSLPQLKKLKNDVIGNPTAKIQLARDLPAVQKLIQSLDSTPVPRDDVTDALRTEAAHVLASLAYGSDETLETLLRADALTAVLYALSSSYSPALRTALARALRALASAIADVFGPSRWGLRADTFSARQQASEALDHLFHIDSLDIYLPLIARTPPQPSVFRNTALATAISIAHLLASAVRHPAHRHAIVEWAPPAIRTAQGYHQRAHRGWEREEGEKGGGWVVRALVHMIRERDMKAQEAALWALAALAKDNPSVATALSRNTSEDPATLPLVLSLAKVRTTDVQLAACLCITNIIRANPTHVPIHHYTSHSLSSSAPSSSSSALHTQASAHTAHSLHHAPAHPHAPPYSAALLASAGAYPVHAATDPDTCARTVMSVVNRMIGDDLWGGGQERLEEKNDERDRRRIAVRACFILFHLVSDDPVLCQAAFERGCLDSLASLVQRLTSLPHPTSVQETPDLLGVGGGRGGASSSAPLRAEKGTALEEDAMSEPESVSALREAALTTIAAIALFDNDIRRFLTSGSAASTATLLPCISVSLSHPRPGVRYAACQCVRAVSRAVAVLRTGVVDSGLGMGVWEALGREMEREKRAAGVKMAVGEDRMGEDGEEKRGHEGEKGDRRVIGAALAAVCNLMNDFSPLRETLLEAGLIPRLVQVLELTDAPDELRVSALWAVKNLLCKTATETKRDVLVAFGSSRLVELLKDPHPGVQEQALHVVRNLSENEDGIELVYGKIGPRDLLECVIAAMGSTNMEVMLQACYVLGNLANGREAHQAHLLTHPRVLAALRTALVSTHKTEIRRPVVACVSQLACAARGPGRSAIKKAGFEDALKQLCEWGGSGVVSASGASSSGVAGLGSGMSGSSGGGGGGRGVVLGVGLERDGDVIERAREALHLLQCLD